MRLPQEGVLAQLDPLKHPTQGFVPDESNVPTVSSSEGLPQLGTTAENLACYGAADRSTLVRRSGADYYPPPAVDPLRLAAARLKGGARRRRLPPMPARTPRSHPRQAR